MCFESDVNNGDVFLYGGLHYCGIEALEAQKLQDFLSRFSNDLSQVRTFNVEIASTPIFIIVFLGSNRGRDCPPQLN